MRLNEVGKSILYRCGKSRMLYLAVSFSLLLGLVIGTCSALTLQSAALSDTVEYMNRFFSAYSLQSVNKYEVFQIALYNNFKSLLLFWVSGLSLFLIPFAFLQVGIKGFKIGFSVALLSKAFRWKGVLFALVSMLPQNLIVLPLLILYGVFIIRKAGQLYQLKKKNNVKLEKKRLYLSGLKAVLVTSVLLVICSALEAYFVPVIVRPVCSFMV